LFSIRDKEMIDFGRFTVYQSLKEMIDEGDNLNNIKFDSLVEDTTRNIVDSDLINTINEVISEFEDDSQTKDWREDLK
jgi:hypothetical protein